MKACTEKQKEWLWFAGLWCGGLAAALALALAVRWMLSI